MRAAREEMEEEMRQRCACGAEARQLLGAEPDDYVCTSIWTLRIGCACVVYV